MDTPTWCKLLLLLLILGIAPSKAFGEKLWVYTEDLPPYNYEKDGRLVGMSAELVTELLERIELDYEHRLVPWRRGYHMAQYQENTLLYSTVRTPAREHKFKWVGPLYSVPYHFYRLKRREDIKIDRFEDIKKYRTGVPDGDYLQDYLDSHGFDKFNSKTILNMDMIFPMLYRQRIDLVIYNPFILAHRISNHPEYHVDDFAVAWLGPESVHYYLAVNRNTSKTIISTLNSALKSLIDDGTRDRIVEHYVGAFD